MLINTLELEKKYKEKLEIIPEWNYLRNYYRQTDSGITSHINKFKVFKNLFYGFFSWFKKYDYLYFSDSSERKNINNKKFDILCDSIVDHIGQDLSLVIEKPFSNNHFDKKCVNSNNIVSYLIFNILSVILVKFYNEKVRIEVLEDINQEYNLNIDYKYRVRLFNAQLKIFNIYFKFIKPKVIFFNCYYDKQAIVKVANDLNIKTVEIQHGIISSMHSAYISDLELDSSYIPKYLFAVSEKVKQILINKKSVYNQENIFITGSYYLNYLQKNFIHNEKLRDIQSRYSFSLAITLQKTFELKMLNFINVVANKLPNILFIIIPRDYSNNEINFNLKNSNMIMYPELDCYNILLHCDLHCTIYSTCAIEAPFLGIKNILINIENNSHILDEFTTLDNTSIVEDFQDFQDLINLYLQKNEFSGKIDNELNKNNSVLNYTDNLKIALKEIM